MNRDILLTWPDFRDTINDRNLRLQWYIEDGFYVIFAQDGAIDLRTSIFKRSSNKTSEQTDFENNYKSQNSDRVGQNKYASDDRLLEESMLEDGRGNGYRASVVQIGDGTNALRTDSQVVLRPNSATNLFTEKASGTDSNGNTITNMAVDGSSSEVIFEITPGTEQDKIIEDLTFSALADGIKFEQFLSIKKSLTNGILVEIKTENVKSEFEVIKATEDFEDSWCISPKDFSLVKPSGSDKINATKALNNSVIVLKPQGTFDSGDDYVRVRIRDDLSRITKILLRGKGFFGDGG